MAKKKDTPSIQGYFRAIYKENPKLLEERSNDVVLERWLKDHPDQKEVPDKIKQSLSNVKAIMRKKLALHGRRKDAAERPHGVQPKGQTRKAAGLDQLEALIDDALHYARQLASPELEDVVRGLRIVRNRVIVQMEG